MRPLLEAILSKVRGAEARAGAGETAEPAETVASEFLLQLPVLQ